MKGKALVLLIGPVIVLTGYAWEWQIAGGRGWPVGNPAGLRNVGFVLVALGLLFGYVVPFFFWRRCPYCPGTTLSPVYLQIYEGLVHPGGTDDAGEPLPPIIRRDYVCPQCGYRQITYRYVSPGASFFGFPTARALGTNIQPFTLSDDWSMTTSRQAGFHSFKEWKAYYDELKSMEREEVRGPHNG